MQNVTRNVTSHKHSIHIRNATKNQHARLQTIISLIYPQQPAIIKGRASQNIFSRQPQRTDVQPENRRDHHAMPIQRKIPERFWCVKQIHIFRDLTEDDADALKRITTFKTLKHKDPVSDEGVYLLKEGRIKIYETPTEGEPVTLAVMEPGEIFGAIEWDNNEAGRKITAEILTTEAVIGIVRAKHFQFFLKRKMHLAMPFKRPLYQRVLSAIDNAIIRGSDGASKWTPIETSGTLFATQLLRLRNVLSKWMTPRRKQRDEMTNPFTNIAFRSPESRLALLLRNYADAPKQNCTITERGSQGTLRKLSTKKLALLIGCSIEKIETLLNQFKQHGILEKRYRRIQILDPWHLKKIANARMQTLPPKTDSMETDNNRENTETYEQTEPLLAVRPTDGR